MSKYLPQIGVYAIMKDEKHNIPAWADTVRDADFVTVLDTGSTDGSRKLLRECLGQYMDPEKVYIETCSIIPFRFDIAHNSALAFVPEWIDVAVPLAMDEQLSEGWRKAIINAIPYNSWLRTTHENRPAASLSTKFTYHYEFAPGLSFTHDRIHSRYGYSWRYPFHEGVYPAFGYEERVHVPGLEITQRQDVRVNRAARDLTLAEMALREFPNDPRMTFYAGRQFMYAGDFARAVQTLERYGPLARQHKHEHPVEAGWVHQALADCYRQIAKQRGL